MNNKSVFVRAPKPCIVRLRGQSVMLDTDLAPLYGVGVKRLDEQVKRNTKPFPEDFAFMPTDKEWANLESQFAISSGHDGRHKLPYAFTEHGAIMAINVLNSEQVQTTSVAVFRAFVTLHRPALSVEVFTRTVVALESKYDAQFRDVFHPATDDPARSPAPQNRI